MRLQQEAGQPIKRPAALAIDHRGITGLAPAG